MASFTSTNSRPSKFTASELTTALPNDHDVPAHAESAESITRSVLNTISEHPMPSPSPLSSPKVPTRSDALRIASTSIEHVSPGRRGKLDDMRWGDDHVPVLQRSWTAADNVFLYRKTYALRPGQHWRDAPVSETQYEHLVSTDDGPLPVGVVISRELIDTGASWAVMVELWGRTTLVNHNAECVELSGEVGELLAQMRAANNDRWGGFADVVGLRGDNIVLREAKVGGGRDRLRPNQHDFMRAMRRRFGDRVDAAIIEWDAPQHQA